MYTLEFFSGGGGPQVAAPLYVLDLRQWINRGSKRDENYKISILIGRVVKQARKGASGARIEVGHCSEVAVVTHNDLKGEYNVGYCFKNVHSKRC